MRLDDLVGKITYTDCKEILPLMNNKSVDVVLTDVPYDLSRNMQEYFHFEFTRIARRCVLIFSPPENQWVFPNITSYLFWIKPISTKNTSKHYSRFVEMIFHYDLEQPVWNSERHWSQYTNVFTDLVDDTSQHAYRKPPSLIERLLRNHTNEGDIVFDPFAGSGVIGDVCKQLNRRYIGIEIKETKHDTR